MYRCYIEVTNDLLYKALRQCHSYRATNPFLLDILQQPAHEPPVFSADMLRVASPPVSALAALAPLHPYLGQALRPKLRPGP
eukprot:SAG11_NODE_975_length_6331_cov_4.407895_5_plen_82_part_00